MEHHSYHRNEKAKPADNRNVLGEKAIWQKFCGPPPAPGKATQAQTRRISVEAQRRQTLAKPLKMNGAPARVRTRDPLITNQVLYQLSYKGSGGVNKRISCGGKEKFR